MSSTGDAVPDVGQDEADAAIGLANLGRAKDGSSVSNVSLPGDSSNKPNTEGVLPSPKETTHRPTEEGDALANME
eukprot:11912942-Ditylum_brightwellii.AAC.1